MVFEVPWDFFRGPRGPISAPGHDRIFSTSDFSHLWGALHRHASRFSGLFFGSKRGFKWYVNDKRPPPLVYEKSQKLGAGQSSTRDGTEAIPVVTSENKHY